MLSLEPQSAAKLQSLNLDSSQSPNIVAPKVGLGTISIVKKNKYKKEVDSEDQPKSAEPEKDEPPTTLAKPA